MIGIMACGMAVSLPSCDEEDTPTAPDSEQPGGEDTPKEKEEFFYIESEKCGVRTVTFLNQNQDVKYSFDIWQGGEDTGNEATVSLAVMTAEELTQYNTANGTNYTAILPKDCYSFTADYTGFTKETLKQTAEITFKAKTGSLNFATTEYVLPLKLSAADKKVKIDENRNIIILRPSISTPLVAFMGDLEAEPYTIYKGQEEEKSYEFDVTLDRDNLGWDFTVKTETDEAKLTTLVTAYNEANATTCSLLPAANYTIGALQFTGNDMQKQLTVTIKNIASLGLDKNYLLPVVLKSCEGMPFNVDTEKVIYIPVNYLSLPQVALKGKVSTNCTGDGKNADLLIDGKKDNTQWQSIWGKSSTDKPTDRYDATYGVYIDIKDVPITQTMRLDLFAFAQNNYPTQIKIYCGTDQNNLTELKEISKPFDFSSDGVNKCTTEDIDLTNKSTGLIRIALLQSKNGGSLTGELGWWKSGSWWYNQVNVGLSEIELYGY